MKRNWDEVCPHCGIKIENLYDRFVCRDYSTDFTFDCVECGQMIQCDVEAVPTFALSKAETPAEYEAKRLAAIERMKR